MKPQKRGPEGAAWPGFVVRHADDKGLAASHREVCQSQGRPTIELVVRDRESAEILVDLSTQTRPPDAKNLRALRALEREIGMADGKSLSREKAKVFGPFPMRNAMEILHRVLSATFDD